MHRTSVADRTTWLTRLVALAGAAAVAMAAMPAAAQDADDDRAKEGDATLKDKQVVVLIGEGFQDAEALFPMAYLQNRGASVTVIGVRPELLEAYNSELTLRVERAVSDISVDDFDALVLPGGRGPEWLRQHDEVVEFAGRFFESGKLVAAVCHGPQLLVSAGVLEDRKATCVSSISHELQDAGAEYHDVPVMVDDNLVTSRLPEDLPKFCDTIEKHLLGKEIDVEDEQETQQVTPTQGVGTAR